MLDAALLCNTIQSFGLALDAKALARCDLFARLLAERNQSLNLTAVTAADEVAVKHFADSLSLLPRLPLQPGLRLLDVGTGAGFPGIPLLIARPDLRLTLLDSTRKKLQFIEEVLHALDLRAETLHMRAEDAGRRLELRGSFDVAVSRAVASLSVLAEYCLPLLAPGGLFIAMKGTEVREELRAAEGALSLLGGGPARLDPVSLGVYGERTLVLVKKESQTLAKYPRVSAQIAKNPL